MKPIDTFSVMLMSKGYSTFSAMQSIQTQFDEFMAQCLQAQCTIHSITFFSWGKEELNFGYCIVYGPVN